MARVARILAAVSGFTAVALGAFGAHGLGPMLEGLADGAKRLGYWETAAHYQLGHVIAFVLCAQLLDRAAGRGARLLHVATWSFALGTLLFSGSLYALALSGVRAFGAFTPIGGVLLLAGWAALGGEAVRDRS